MSDEPPRGFPSFERRAKSLVQTPERVQKLAGQAVRKLSAQGSDSLKNAKDQLLLAIALVRAWVSGDYREVSNKTIVIVVAALLYFVVPLDTIPDFLFGWGLIDDIAVLGYVFTQVKEEMDAFALWQSGGQVEGEAAGRPEGQADGQNDEDQNAAG